MGKTKRKPPAKRPGPDRLKQGREDTAKSCQAVARALAKEAGVKKVEYHDRGLEGRAWLESKRIRVPRPTTRRRLYIIAHECAHIALGHTKNQTAHKQEYECECWAHEALRRHGVAVPAKSTEQAKKYVAWKIHQAVRRKAKRIDADALAWCQEYVSKDVKRWMKENGVSAAGTKKTPRTPARKTKASKRTKEDNPVTAVITQGANIARLVPGDDRDNLANWFNVYMASEVGSDKKDNTFRAKLQDVERFLGYFFERTGGYHCDDWVRSVTKGFLKWLPKQHAKDRQANKTDRLLAASTQVRNVNTIKHAAKWIHRQRPFLAGVPFGKGDGIKVKRGGWKGLSDLQVNRILAAAEKLKHMSRRKDQDPVRDYAAFRVLLHTALRVDEFCSLDLSQYRGKHLVNIPRKGDVVTEKIFLDEPVRAALDEYIEESRGDKAGPLFLSKNGNRLTQQAVYFMLERIADQANTGRREKDQIEVHPHLLRHTQLRKVAREKGIEAALELSGHQSEKYIWRYVQATDDEMEDALTGNWD